MFKNKKMVFSSMAIIFTLIVSAIFVNFTLANSGSPAGDGNTTSSTSSNSITGYSNIDLAIMNSNSASYKKTGEDKYYIVQILPNGMKDTADMDKAMTVKATTTKKDLTKDSDWGSTSYLWRYVYGEEFFRLAVFNGYKTIKADMAKGAVQLTTYTVSELNSMTDAVQETLAKADFVSIHASSASDYSQGSNDLSEEAYEWIYNFSTVDKHPMTISRYALCVSDPSTISGNNDACRMSTLAYKLITKNLMSRYDNILVTEPDFFKVLYEEASNNIGGTPSMEKTTKTISDFILTATRTANEGGKDYINKNTYYKWYDGTSISDFVKGGNVAGQTDSAYAPVVGGSGSGASKDSTRSRKEWNFDNAKILVISENAYSSIYDELIDMKSNDSINPDDYKDTENGWEAVKTAPNGPLTSKLYSAKNDAYIPSGADIYLLNSSDLQNAVTGTAKYTDISFSNTYYEDIKGTDLVINVKSASHYEDASEDAYPDVTSINFFLYAVKKGDDGNDDPAEVGHMVKENSSIIKYQPSDDDLSEDVYSTTINKLNPDYNYYLAIQLPAGENKDDYEIGYYRDGNTLNYIFYDAGEETPEAKEGEEEQTPSLEEGYDYETSMLTITEVQAAYPDVVTDSLEDGMRYSTVEDVMEYVEDKHSTYVSEEQTKKTSFSNIDFSEFDFIFIDKGTYSSEIGSEAYNALCTAVEQGVYVIVSSAAGDGVGSGSGDDDDDDSEKIIVNSPSAKALADIINSGTYRDGADNKFRVLEIQPDAPIDTDVAKTKSNGSKYSKHSDGSAIEGDYYTMPGDLVSGKAKEELPSKTTEYYAYDVTKAKLAYALKELGVDYGDVELTQVSTETLACMKTDLLADYDLIYVGGDISAVDRSVDEIYTYWDNMPGGPDTGGKNTAKTVPTFIMYSHTGYLLRLNKDKMAAGLVNGSSDVWVPESGNDLTSDHYDQLLEYINAGRPIIFSNEITSVYEKMAGVNVENATEISYVNLLSGYWYGSNGSLEKKNYYLDPSSRVYKLVKAAYNKANDATKPAKNIIWGFDNTRTQRIANEDGVYGDTLYTANTDGTVVLDDDAKNEGWYDNTGVIKRYATVYTDEVSSTIKNLVNSSAKRVRLTILSKPTKYTQGIKSTYLRTTTLTYQFNVLGEGTGSYTYKLYVDKDKDVSYEDNGDDYYETGTAKNGENVKVSVSLDEDFFGSAAWYLEINNADDKTVATAKGVSKIINNTDSKSEINVLQVQTNYKGDSTDFQTLSDMLYFDIMSQWAHKIMYYNGTSTERKDGSMMEFEQRKSLGRHENRFGIVEYDTDTGEDDWYSNLADAITDDYDVNIDLAVAKSANASFKITDGGTGTYDCLETWVKEAEVLKAGGNVDGHDQAWYENAAEGALADYSSAMADVEAPKAAIDAYLSNAVKAFNTGVGTDKYKTGFISGISDAQYKKLYQTCLDTGEYTLPFIKLYTDFDASNNFSKYGEYGKLFVAYRDAKDNELNKRDIYRSYLRRSYGEDFLKNMYSILILGPSDEFGGMTIDMSTKMTEYITDFVDNGGDLFFFHDTMTVYNDKGAVNLTKAMLDMVGLNRFHIDLNDQTKSYTQVEAGSKVVQAAQAENGPFSAGDIIVCNDYNHTDYSNGGKLKNGWTKETSTVGWTTYSIKATYSSSLGTCGSCKKFTPAVTEPLYDNEYKSTDKVYLTPYANNPNALQTAGLSSSMKSNNNGDGNNLPNITISALPTSTLYLAKDNNECKGKYQYIYSDMAYIRVLRETTRDGNHDISEFGQTSRAEQLNEGLVTMYPFSIGKILNITGTHMQAYPVDPENNNTTVWYTFGGYNNTSSDRKVLSSMVAADPLDGVDQYYIYTTSAGGGAITYCGSGHLSVTGKYTKNNDERKLFINVIVNSAEAVVPKPSIKVYEPNEKYEDEMKKDQDILEAAGKTVYTTTVETKNDAPNFDFKISLPRNIKLTTVNVYYDLDYDDSELLEGNAVRPTYNSKTDQLIASYKSTDKPQTIDPDSDIFKKAMRLANTSNKLRAQESYFTPYGGNYTYIVIEAYYAGKTTPVYVMIKIKASDPLFNLTENQITTPASLDAVKADEFSL